MNKNETYIDFDADLKSELKPKVQIKVGGEMLHFKRNANLLKAMSTFMMFYIGQCIHEEDPDLPTDVNERHQYIMLKLLQEDNYAMRISFLNMMFVETFDESRMDDLMEYYTENNVYLENKDELAYMLINKLTPIFSASVVDTQKSKPSEKKAK